jgi:hypothetical protein
MYDGEISGNTAGQDASSGKGGGVYIEAATTGGEFMMNGGTIYGSNADAGLKNNAGLGGASPYNNGGSAKKNGVALSTMETTITAP